MTPIDPFERQLPVALTRLADPRTPDYLTDILGRTARTRQRSAWRSLERWLPVPSLTSPRALALLAVAALAAVILGSALLGGGGGPAPMPSTMPSASASPSATALATAAPSPVAEPVEDGLAGGWVAPLRGLQATEAGATMTLTVGATSGRLAAPDIPRERDGGTSEGFAIAEVGPGSIELTASPDGATCAAGDVGQYDYDISTAGWLTLTLREDSCAARGAILEGAWQRSLAHGSQGGPEIATAFDPVLSFTLPDGRYTARGYGEVDTIVIDASDSTFKVWKNLDGFADPCDIDKGRLLLDPGMDAFLAYLTGDARFTVVRQEEFTIDGRRAVEMELGIGENLTTPCWTLDGDPDDRTGVLTWVPKAAGRAFWNAKIGDPHILVVTEVDGVTLTFEALTFPGGGAPGRSRDPRLRPIPGRSAGSAGRLTLAPRGQPA